MNKFLNNVIEGQGITPPETCVQALNQNFKDAIQIEWFERDSYFEAIFYKDNLEYIPDFEPAGILLEYRVFLPAENLPENIRLAVVDRGEIMNIVLRNKGNRIEYEIILRENQMQRLLITLSDVGKVLYEKIL